LLDAFDGEASRLVKFLELDVANSAIQQVIAKYRPSEAAQAEQKGLHFSKGKTGRFRQKYTPEQQAILANKLGGYLTTMDYAI
jgi:hypothetical protein